MIKPPEEEGSFYDYFVPFTTKKAIIFIVIIGLLVFFNSLFNPFQGDDSGQIVNNPLITHVYNIPSFFYSSLVYSGINSINFLHIYYKPLLFTVFTLIYTLFGSSPLPFHVIQLVVHIANTVLLFFILSRFMKQKIAFPLSLLYLVHPINSEAVIYIADMQEVLFVFFGLLAINTIMSIKHSGLSIGRISSVALLLLCSLFSKETGILFLAMAFMYELLFAKEKIKGITVATVVTIAIYASFRFLASLFSYATIVPPSLIQKASLETRLITIPQIVFYYFSKFVLPIHLAIGQDWVVKQTTFTNFYFPLLILILIFAVIFGYGIHLYKEKNAFVKHYIFFTIWLCIGILMHMQLLPLDVTVADRWFYFPVIGLLGIIGIFFNTFSYPSMFLKNLKQFFIALLCLLIALLSIMTIVRNSEWQTRFQLLAHDVQYAQSPVIDSYYGGILLLNRQPDLAKGYLEKSVANEPELGHNINNLAIVYEREGNYTQAQALYWKNIHENSNFSKAYIYISYDGLAHIALSQKNPQEAKQLTTSALKIAPLDSHAMEYLAIAEYQLGEKNEALQTVQKLYSYFPNTESEGLFLLIKSDKPFGLSPQFGSTVIY